MRRVLFPSRRCCPRPRPPTKNPGVTATTLRWQRNNPRERLGTGTEADVDGSMGIAYACVNRQRAHPRVNLLPVLGASYPVGLLSDSVRFPFNNFSRAIKSSAKDLSPLLVKLPSDGKDSPGSSARGPAAVLVRFGALLGPIRIQLRRAGVRIIAF
jgi:hypothetical protein